MLIDCIILAGGLGTRLRETVPDRPKPLALINGRPFLDILLNQISKLPLKKKVLAISYKADQIIDYYKNSEIEFSIEESPLGTGGGLKLALEKTTSPYVLVMNGDSYLDFNFSALFEKESDLTIACRHVEDVSRYGNIELDETGKIIAFHEKNPLFKKSGIINGGIYLMKRSLLDSFSGSFSLEKDLFPKVLNRKVYGTLCFGKFIDIGTKESYFEAQDIL